MTLSNAMTSLMDKARELTGLSEKISLSHLTELMNHFDLHVNPNLILADRINVAVTSHAKDAYPNWQNEYISNPLKPDTTYTISACATTSDTRVANASIGNRIGFELQTTDIDNGNHWNGPWYYPHSEAGSTHLSLTQYISEKAIKSIKYCSAYNQINSTATVKVTNFKIVVNPMREDK